MHEIVNNPTFTLEELKEVLYYHPESGDFVWIAPPINKKYLLGKQAGKFQDGYLMVRTFWHALYAHHLAWFYINGVWPTSEMDHINGNSLDNRIANLRLANRFQNVQNNISRAKLSNLPRGVRIEHSTGKYVASIRAYKARHHLGTFSSAEEAGAAYLAAKLRLHDCPLLNQHA
jgi:HNH endonuclease/AP2 domain